MKCSDETFGSFYFLVLFSFDCLLAGSLGNSSSIVFFFARNYPVFDSAIILHCSQVNHFLI